MTGTESLGWSVYSRRSAKKGGRARPIPEAFPVRVDDDRISVDRMDHAQHSELARIAAVRGRERDGDGRDFQGWAILTASDAAANGRSVEASPLPENPYHVDSCLNLSDSGERREAQKEHALDLAARASWEDCPREALPSGKRRAGT